MPTSLSLLALAGACLLSAPRRVDALAPPVPRRGRRAAVPATTTTTTTTRRSTDAFARRTTAGGDGDGDGDGDATAAGAEPGGDAPAARAVACAASVLLPFPAEVAFDAFSDLTRQPSWCKYLHSVKYLDDGDAADGAAPLRRSEWTVGVKGLRFSWRSRETCLERPHRIEWESTSGLKNMGEVVFVPQSPPGQSPSSSSPRTPPSSCDATTRMTIRFTFVAPRIVAGLLRRTGKVRAYTEDVLLTSLLENFRDVVSEEESRAGGIPPEEARDVVP